MPNHFHLMVETPQPNLVAGMKWFLGTYTSRFNRRHKLFGHLFWGRYKSLIVDGSGSGYLKSVCDYVHLNPGRAKLLPDAAWGRVEKYVRVSFWRLNIGLALMVLLNLFPGGIVQLRDVLENGYWHARSLDFIGQPLMRTLEWLRLPGDMVFILAGVVLARLAAATAWRFRNKSAGATANQ